MARQGKNAGVFPRATMGLPVDDAMAWIVTTMAALGRIRAKRDPVRRVVIGLYTDWQDTAQRR
jgi:hypothetical protein